ncbi:hypothetical protein [Anaplasma marginale]|uniref:hypothetical protein n=1 Tax=Anaplasma marginale TaxID=770 RepID=UPI00030DBDD1|nr:hypothetical protein [Anaplasma marginale]
MLSLQKTSYLAPTTTNNNASLFLTAEFQGLAKLLADTNSLPMLSGFLAGVVGTNSAMAGYPYISILRHNLRLSRDDIEKLTNFEHGHYNRTWMTEVLCQSLLQIAQEHNVDGPQLQRLAYCCASKIYKLHGKSSAYNFFSPASIACVQELSSYLQRVGINAHLSLDVITENSLKVLDNLSRYFALKMRQEFCLLLTFYGASYDKLPPACMSAVLVRRILHVHGKAVQTPVRNLSTQETRARQLVSEAITTHLEQTKKRLEYVEVIVNRRHPWYMLHRKLVQFFYAVFILPKLREDYGTLKRLDAVYKDSIMYGDCAKFFESLHNIKLMNIDRYKKHPELVATLRAVQSSYKVASHTEYMATVRNCTSQPRPLPLRCFALTNPKYGGVLGLAHQKVRTKMGTVSRWLKRQSHAARCKLEQNTGYYPTTMAANAYEQPKSRACGSTGDDDAVAALHPRPSNDNFRLRTGTLLTHLLKLLSRKQQHRASSLTALNLCYANGIGHMLAGGTKASAARKVRRPVGTHTSRYLRESQRARSLLLHAESLCNLYTTCADQELGHDSDVESSPASNDHTKKSTKSFSSLLLRISQSNRCGYVKAGNFGSLGKKRKLASYVSESMSSKCVSPDQGVDAHGDVRPSTQQLPTNAGHKQKCGINNAAERRTPALRSAATPSSNDNCVSESSTASSTTLAQSASAGLQRRKKKHRVVHALKKRLLWALCAAHTCAAELPGSDAPSITSEHSSHSTRKHKTRKKPHSAAPKQTLVLYVPPLTTNEAEGECNRCTRSVTSEHASGYESTDSSCGQATSYDERTSCSR